ncbi:MAG TPA: hypothetical protein VFA18_02795 [Gemmataceae bacterium]|nr:hypothetical protein [Gemmataceae bacterium]
MMAAVAVVGLLTMPMRAADTKTATGTWTSTFERNGQTFKTTYKLKQDGQKLTGTVKGGPDNKESEIKDGSVKDGKVSFTVTRESPNGGEVTIHYHGKLTDNAIQGKADVSFGDQKRSFDWKATRAK